MTQPSRFMTADWRYLIMLNYEVEAAVLQPYVPAGTELDTWQGRTFISLVGFLFLNTCIIGAAIPFHENFEEVNLRFYTRREANGEERRAVTFIKEIVPKPAIALVARLLYNENYVSLPMRHHVAFRPAAGQASYEWRHRGKWHGLAATVSGEPAFPSPGSEEEFITEHYWGYAAQPDGSTMEYRVEHPPWRVWSAAQSELVCEVEELYGFQFAGPLSGQPTSAFVADGSAVTVYKGYRL